MPLVEAHFEPGHVVQVPRRQARLDVTGEADLEPAAEEAEPAAEHEDGGDPER